MGKPNNIFLSEIARFIAVLVLLICLSSQKAEGEILSHSILASKLLFQKLSSIGIPGFFLKRLSQTLPFSQHQYTADLCEPSDLYFCAYPRQCLNSSLQPCFHSDEYCGCFESTLTSCVSSYDCLIGDRCAIISNSSDDPICVSCTVTENNEAIYPIDDKTYCFETNVEPEESPWLTPDPESTVDGATGAECTTLDSCFYPRVCADIGNLTLLCTANSVSCFCVSEDYIQCTTSSECLIGDRCVSSIKQDSEISVCFSCFFLENLIEGVDYYGADDGSSNCKAHVNDGPISTPTPTPMYSTEPFEESYTLDHCTTSSNTCAYPRTCYSAHGYSLCDESEEQCICMSLENLLCSKSSECLYGDRCVTYSILPYGVCVSCSVDLETFSSIEFTYIDDDESQCSGILTPSPSLETSPSQSAVPPSDGGYSYDPCNLTGLKCTYPRVCVGPESGTCQLSDSFCFCISTQHLNCYSSYDCLYGDRCVETSEGIPICASCNLTIESRLSVTVVDNALGNCPEPAESNLPNQNPSLSPTPSLPHQPNYTMVSSPLPSSPFPSFSAVPSLSQLPTPSRPYPSPTSSLPPTGFTFDDCTSNNYICVSPRMCYSVSTGEFCRSMDSDCVCASLSNFTCSDSPDCLLGDRCVLSADATARFCLSCFYDYSKIEISFVDDGGYNCYV